MRLRPRARRRRPAGVPDSAVSIGSRLRALAVYLVICQHVPVERCRELIADVTGAAVSAGFIHSCLAAGAAAVADAVTLIRALITAAPVAGFDETTLRAGPAGVRKYVLGAFTERHSAFHLGARTLASFHDFAILDGFAGIVVSDRYVNFHDSWKHITGHQACAAHLLRFEDAAQSWSVATWPAQAQRALRALIGAWHKARDQNLAAIPDATAGPLTREFRHAVLAGLSDLPRIPGPKGSTAQHPGRDLLEFCKHREQMATLAMVTLFSSVAVEVSRGVAGRLDRHHAAGPDPGRCGGAGLAVHPPGDAGRQGRGSPRVRQVRRR